MKLTMKLMPHPPLRSASPATAAALLTASLLLPASAFGGLVTWDDLPTGAYVDTPAGYGGVNWFYGDDAFGVGTSLQYTTTSITGAPSLSSPNAAYNAWGNTPMRVESLTAAPGAEFTFSGWFASGPNDVFFSGATGAAQIEVQGFIGGSSTPAFTTTFSPPTDGSWVQESFTGTAVNKLLFSPLDSNGNPSGLIEGYFFLDNAQITAVPEPATWTIAGAAGCGLFAFIRRRRTS
jgi:hypothetical protein